MSVHPVDWGQLGRKGGQLWGSLSLVVEETKMF